MMRKRELFQMVLCVGSVTLFVYAIITRQPLAALAALVPASCACVLGG